MRAITESLVHKVVRPPMDEIPSTQGSQHASPSAEALDVAHARSVCREAARLLRASYGLERRNFEVEQESAARCVADSANASGDAYTTQRRARALLPSGESAP